MSKSFKVCHPKFNVLNRLDINTLFFKTYNNKNRSDYSFTPKFLMLDNITRGS